MIRHVSWKRRIRALARRPIVLVGLLLLVVGTPEIMVGHSKARAYRTMLAALPSSPRPADPTEVFPKPTGADEKRAVVVAKIGYYDLLSAAGRVLVVTGLLLIFLGIVHARRYPGAATGREFSP